MPEFPKPLGVLLLTFTLLVLLHSWATPIFEAPDEVWHYAYARWLATGHDLPAMDGSDESGAGQEVAQPPLYYGVAALFSAPFPDADLPALSWHNPHFGYQAPGATLDNKNMLIHTAREQFPWRGAVLALHVTRLASLLFGLLAVLSAWGLGSETFGTRTGALLTAMLVAFQPQFVFISSVVNNDSAAAALTTAALWLTARMLRRGVTGKRALATGAVAGLAILSKTSTLLLLPFIGVALLWAGWREKRSLKELVAPALGYGVTTLAVGGWWYARNFWLYGSPLGLSAHLNTLWGRAEPVSLLALLPEIPLLVRSFWGAYGWGHIFWPAPVYLTLTLGSGYFLVRSATRSLRRREHTGAMLALAWLWGSGILGALLYWMRQVEAPHGRLLFPALGAWALLVAAGMQELQRPRLTRLALLTLATLTALAPGVRIWPAFAPPRLHPLPEEVTEVLSYAGRARLLSVELPPEGGQAGKEFTVRACWEALQPMTADYMIFVQLVGRENTRVGERHTYPGLGRFPTSLWPVGSYFCDTYRFPVAAWAPAPELYDVLIGLYDAKTEVHLTPHNPAGEEVALPVAATVRIAPEAGTKPTPEYATAYRLGANIELLGYNIPDVVRSQRPLTLTLYWRTGAPLSADYKVFVHLRDAAGAIIAQHDGQPRGGRYPTTTWRADELIPDTHQLAIPTLAPGQELQLLVGLYHQETLERLPVSGPEGALPHGTIVLSIPHVEE
ncbi:MAG: glycosyltransferase family 39 protein [Chloroflexota bacterium]|nr:glycosyltransferase family 39 protein [Chloroflexota bacterium]